MKKLTSVAVESVVLWNCFKKLFRGKGNFFSKSFPSPELLSFQKTLINKILNAVAKTFLK